VYNFNTIMGRPTVVLLVVRDALRFRVLGARVGLGRVRGTVTRAVHAVRTCRARISRISLRPRGSADRSPVFMAPRQRVSSRKRVKLKIHDRCMCTIDRSVPRNFLWVGWGSNIFILSVV
jgi:hypothetical protein